MYLKIDVTKPSGISAGTGSGKHIFVVVDAEDVSVVPPRDTKGVKVLGNYVLKPNARMVKLYTTKSKGSFPVESDGDEDSINMKHKVEVQHPGNKLEIKEFIQNWLGRDAYVFHGSCSDNFLEVMGTPCAPLQLKPSKTDNNDARFWQLMFEAFATSQYVPGHYEGELVFGDPETVADAEAIAIDTEVNAQYKLPATAIATSIAFDTVAANHGDVVTVIGQGGATAATLAQDVASDVLVILKDGTTWTALDGAVIHFQVFKAGAKTVLSEMSRG